MFFPWPLYRLFLLQFHDLWPCWDVSLSFAHLSLHPSPFPAMSVLRVVHIVELVLFARQCPLGG